MNSVLILFRLVLICQFLLILNACLDKKNITEEHIERFENGAISRKFSVINGKKEGIMTDYYPEGQLMAERNFVSGKQAGTTTIYYPSGAKKEVQYYVGGAQNGGDTIWYEDGKIQFTVFLRNDKKDGYLRKWSPDGTIIFESKYAMDTLVEVKGQPISRESILERSISDTVIGPKSQKR